MLVLGLVTCDLCLDQGSTRNSRLPAGWPLMRISTRSFRAGSRRSSAGEIRSPPRVCTTRRALPRDELSVQEPTHRHGAITAIVREQRHVHRIVWLEARGVRANTVSGLSDFPSCSVVTRRGSLGPHAALKAPTTTLLQSERAAGSAISIRRFVNPSIRHSQIVNDLASL